MKVFIAGLAGAGFNWIQKELAQASTNGLIDNHKDAMKIYLAGASTGNNVKIWRDNAYTNPEESMKVFLAGLQSEKNRANSENDFAQKLCILESFYYIKDWMKPYINNHWDFLLDSGAFTFMSDPKNQKGVNWDEYVEKYANFINENNIDNFFELDIDNVVGIDEVHRLRKKLEKMTNKQSIPVWHKSRGKDYWFKMIDEYGYVSIGGIVAGGLTYRKKLENIFPWFLETARKKDCKVHALGYTSVDNLEKYKFYSVDSTAWLYGNRGGFIYHFNGKTLEKMDKPKGTRLKAKEVAMHNFKEWVKFQQYALNNL